MYKILVVDRCFFSRLGLKAWLSQNKSWAQDIIITETNDLQVANEMMTEWQPNLIIADFNFFFNTLKKIRQISIVHDKKADNTSIILLQKNHHSHINDVSKNSDNIYILDKSIRFKELEKVITEYIFLSPEEKTKKCTLAPLLTLREERILKLWKNEVNNSCIARLMGISIKTVYTYKRNIRVKLGAENRLSLIMNISS